MIVLSLSAGGGQVELHLASYLRGELWDRYREVADTMRWIPSERVLRAPLSELGRIQGMCQERELVFEVSEELAEAARSLVQTSWMGACDVKKTWGTLFEFQRYGAMWLGGTRAGLLADEMGLGKTRQALAALRVATTAVVVCPAFLKSVWREECHAVRPELVVWDGKGWCWPKEGQVVLVSYEQLRRYASGSVPHGIQLIFDEAHCVKHFSAGRTKKASQLAELVRDRGGTVWLLTGTPITRSPLDAWALSRILGTGVLGPRNSFALRMGGTKNPWGGWRFSPTEESFDWLRTSLAPYMLRRMRAEVMPQLPERTYQDIDVEVSGEVVGVCEGITQSDKWKAFERFPPSVAAMWKTVFGDELMHARELLAVAKIPAMLEVVRSFEEQREPLVVFSAHRAPIEALTNRRGWRTVLGGASDAATQDEVADFQSGRAVGFGGTLGAAGVGITLTRACHALFVDLDWSPALNDQAEARLLRIGQKNAVTIHRLVARIDLERSLFKLLSRKERLIEGALRAS